jgi:hypothetical protein
MFLGIGDHYRPVEALSESASDDRPGGSVMAASPCMDVRQQLASMVHKDATHEYSNLALSIKIPIDEPEGFDQARDALGPGVVTREFPLHHPFQDWDPPVGIFKIGF